MLATSSSPMRSAEFKLLSEMSGYAAFYPVRRTFGYGYDRASSARRSRATGRSPE